jgi:hypothetical protein
MVRWAFQFMDHDRGIRREPPRVEAHHREFLLTSRSTKFHQLSPVLTPIRCTNYYSLPDPQTCLFTHTLTGQPFQEYLDDFWMMDPS